MFCLFQSQKNFLAQQNRVLFLELRCLGNFVVSEQPILSLRLKGDIVYYYFEGEAQYSSSISSSRMGTILFVLVSWISSIYFNENIFNVFVRRSGQEVGPLIPKKLSDSMVVNLLLHQLLFASAIFFLNLSSLFQKSLEIMRYQALSTAINSYNLKISCLLFQQFLFAKFFSNVLKAVIMFLSFFQSLFSWKYPLGEKQPYYCFTYNTAGGISNFQNQRQSCSPFIGTKMMDSKGQTPWIYFSVIL